jgi:hypothetical protein
MLQVAVLFGFAFAFVYGCRVRYQDLLSVESFWSSRARTSSVVPEMTRNYFRSRRDRSGPNPLKSVKRPNFKPVPTNGKIVISMTPGASHKIKLSKKAIYITRSAISRTYVRYIRCQ